jgi:hypothetical protein
MIPRPIALRPRCHRDDPAADRDQPPRPLGYAPANARPAAAHALPPALEHEDAAGTRREPARAWPRVVGAVLWGRGAIRSDRRAGAVVHVAELAEARAKAREPSVLFVSNHVELRACKVTEVAFGTTLPAGRAARPSPTMQSGDADFRVRARRSSRAVAQRLRNAARRGRANPSWARRPRSWAGAR